MNLYLLSHNVFGIHEADYFESCVVCAENEEEARLIHPNSQYLISPDLVAFDNKKKEWVLKDSKSDGHWSMFQDTWCSPELVKVKFIGTADESIKKGVICRYYKSSY